MLNDATANENDCKAEQRKLIVVMATAVMISDGAQAIAHCRYNRARTMHLRAVRSGAVCCI